MATTDDEFNLDEFILDTNEASCAAAGAWLRCLHKMQKTGDTGRVTLPLVNYARLFGMTVDQAESTIDEIVTLGIGDAIQDVNESSTIQNGDAVKDVNDNNSLRNGDAVTERNKKITLENRRMRRAYLVREGNKNRQSEYRDRKARGERNGIVTKSDKNALVVEEINTKKEKKKRKNVATTRIPDPFPLTDEMIDWAKAECPGLRLIEAHENFIEYWTNNATAKGEKVDWILTWKKGMKLALRWQISEETNGSNKLFKSSGPNSTKTLADIGIFD